MEIDDLWQKFAESGSIMDYLRYRTAEEAADENFGGNSSQGTLRG